MNLIWILTLTKCKNKLRHWGNFNARYLETLEIIIIVMCNNEIVFMSKKSLYLWRYMLNYLQIK